MDDRTKTAELLMNEYAERTGLSGENRQKRYLWTDAFGVCNFLGLAEGTGNKEYTARSRKLIESVHNTLGKHRQDDRRTGWISGLSDGEGQSHPTAGGLRIGKPMNERSPDEPYDSRTEWDRDGQYFHYLTKWMHALGAAGISWKDTDLVRQAAELARAAFRGFTYKSYSGDIRMYWKMSIDLSRPLVPSMGHHDPLDGLAGFSGIQTHLNRDYLSAEINTLSDICRGRDWTTDDPLGIGGLLFDCFRLLSISPSSGTAKSDILMKALNDAVVSLKTYSSYREELSASRRLAFRELGLSISLHGARKMTEAAEGVSASAVRLAKQIEKYSYISDKIEEFWLNKEHRNTRLWSEHEDINSVMLASSLVPEGFLRV
ncbi:MAG: hypothetical protein ACLFST_02250 [Spirochaetia bacterium]